VKLAFAIGLYLPEIGGAEVFLHNLATRLRARGHETTVLASFPSWAKLGRTGRRALPYALRPLPPRLASWLPAAPRAYLSATDRYLALQQRRARFDAWTSFGAFPLGVAVGHFAASVGVPHVLRETGTGLNVDAALGYGYRRDARADALVRAWVPRASRCVALTPSVADAFAEAGVPRERVSVIPAAVDVERFDGVKPDVAEVRRRLGVPEDAFVFVAVGNDRPVKGYHVLLDAFARVREASRERVHLLVVGRGTSARRGDAARLGIADACTFVEGLGTAAGPELPLREVIEAYKASDACVFPTLLETFGQVNIEAMAAGTPLVTTDAPGCRDVVTPEVDALVAKRGDPGSLAERMIEVLASSETRARLRSGGRTSVLARYGWDSVVTAYEKVYREALA
jgi:glycosyltransferase involved in cell wall biosynthesis